MEILKWILDIRSKGLLVTDELIFARAKYLCEIKKLKIDCKFSNGWIRGFKKRYHIVRRKGGSKIVRTGDCDISKIISFIKLINAKINSKKYYSIINIDETGLYYDSSINFTLDVKGTKRIEIKTTVREKQRVTLVLGIDLLNNIKMKPLIILKGKTKKCLKNLPKSDLYELSFQKKSWCTENHFIKFLSFLPTDKKILLLCDNFRGHNTDDVFEYIKTKLPLVEIILLPPKTTPLLQPLDIGVNKSLKSNIRTKYIN
jgi:DDE superfamily endonuclease/Tc5 transposase DNA-binding domain